MKLSKKAAAELGTILAINLHNQGQDISARTGALNAYYAIQDAAWDPVAGTGSRDAFTALSNAFSATMDNLEPLTSHSRRRVA